jgi:hypothetical protein
MRFGHWRGVMLAIALMASLTITRAASADGFHNVIPNEVLAQDLSTGQPYMAPPIPWGHYAKSGFGDHYGKTCGICGLIIGKGLGMCGGHGLFGKGGSGSGGCGLFGKHCGAGGCGDPGCGTCHGRGHAKRIKDCGLCKGKGCGICQSSLAGDPIHALASSQSPAPVTATTPQSAPMPSPQSCTEPGCKLGKGHHHDGSSLGDPCGSCGGKGCGFCGGLGRIFGHHGSACDSCGGKGCGKCGLFSGNGCGFCGGKGCGFCAGLKGKISGILHPHRGKIKYFVGPGGPVPLTPGYVPYVNPVRSPRDFLAFPPYTPDGF